METTAPGSVTLSADELLSILRTARQESVGVISQSLVIEAKRAAAQIVKELLEGQSPRVLNSLDVVANVQHIKGIMDAMLSEKTEIRSVIELAKQWKESYSHFLDLMARVTRHQSQTWERLDGQMNRLDAIAEQFRMIHEHEAITNRRLAAIERKLQRMHASARFVKVVPRGQHAEKVTPRVRGVKKPVRKAR